MAKETKILQIKRGSTTDWGNEASPLRAGELGYDTTTKEMKCGDGATAFASLPALGSGGGGGGEVFTSFLMLGIGTGGDYATINEALEVLATWKLGYSDYSDTTESEMAESPLVILFLLPGYAITEPVYVKGIDFSWVKITPTWQADSVDADPVEIDSDAIAGFQYANIWGGMNAVFAAWDGGVLPIINGQYKFVYANPEDKPYLAFMALSSAKGEVGNGTYDPWKVEDCSDVVFVALNGSRLMLGEFGEINGSGYDPIIAEGGSYIKADQIRILNATGDEVIYCSKRSHVSFQGGEINGYDADYGIHAMLGGTINAEEGLVIKTFSEQPDEDSESNTDIVVRSGGVIYANASLGGLSQAPNTVTASGIIFKEIEEP